MQSLQRFLSLAALAGSCLLAQSSLNQQISGQAVDATGSAVANVAVTLTDQGTGLGRTTKTDESGNYSFPNLPVGKYTVACETPGFKKEVIADNPLNTEVSIQVNCKMQVGSQSEAVTVQADAVVVETTSGELGFTVTGEQSSELQLNGRNFPELLALLPGVSTTYNSGFGLFGGYGVNNSGQSINGGRTDTTTWNLDGADNKDNGGGGNNFVNINPDAIGEFRVLTSNFSAESGTSAGAVVNMSIRSGTKNFHGKLYEYWRSDYLAASPYNAAAVGKPIIRWNNFGGNLGGPVTLPYTKFNKNKDKLFFFFSEDLKINRIGATTTWTVPNAALKTGNFGTAVVRDPLTQTPFPNNVIPASLINPDMQKLINIYPLANQGTASYSFNKTTPSNVHEEVLKVDYNLSDNDQVNVHWAHDTYRQLQNTTNLIEYYRNIPGLNTSIQWNHVLSPHWVNVAQFTYTGNVIIEQSERIPNETFIKDFTRKGFGISLPTIYNASGDLPQVAVSGYTTLSVSPLSFNNFNRIFDWKDGITYTNGPHTVKSGILIMRSRKNQDNPPAINGQFTFSTARTPTSGQALGDALLGNFQSYTEFGSIRQGWYRFSQVEPYIQDDWKATRHLTLNIGLRYAYMQPQYSALNNTVQFLPQYFDSKQAAVINPSNGQVISAPNPYNGLVIPGNGFPIEAKGRVAQYADPAVKALFHDLPKGGAYTRWNLYSPRFGFAWDPSGHQTTVIRGGYGIAYERIQGNFIFSGINNAPFNASASVLNGVVTNPGAAASGPVSVQTISNSHSLDMKVPRTMTWSLGGQRKITRTSVLTLTYVGSSAANLSYLDDINQEPMGYGKTHFVPGSTTTLANANSLRPYAGYAVIQQYNSGANFIYSSLQSQFRQQFSKGGSLSVAFTWAKGRTDANSYNYQPMDSYNLRGDWGTSSYSRSKVLVTSWVYPIPFWREGNTWYKQILGGWQVNGVAQMQTGLPVNLTISPDQAGTGDGNQRPQLVGNPYAGGNVGGSQILNPTAFALPALGTFGNLGAFNIFLPNWININSSLVKSFKIREGIKLDTRIEMYNVANHLVTSSINTGSFNGYTTNATTGAITSTTANWGAKSGTTDPRTMQVTMRLNF